MAPSYSLNASLPSIPLPNVAHLTEQDSLAKIDAEIARYENHIRSLRQLRNTVVPIARLPVEVLSKVFFHCHELDILGYNSRLEISWVSRHWRNVALGYPTLWSYIRVFHNDSDSSVALIEYVQACLDRSQNVPLKVLYNGHRSQALSLCASHISRIRQLHLDLDWAGDDSQSLPDEWNTPAPLLTNLYISGVDTNGGIFGGIHPLLDSVHLSFCLHDWISPLSNISRITTLQISEPKEPTTPGVLLSMLQNFPALEFCDLANCFEFKSQTPRSLPIVTKRVHLPNLRSLSVEDDNFDEMVELLEHLDMPKASLDVLLHTDKIPKALFERCFKWFKGYQDRKERKGICRIEVQGCTEVGRSNSFATTSFTTSRVLTFGVLSFAGDFDYDPAVTASEYLALDTVKRVALDSVSMDGLKSFGPLPRLESLEVANMGSEFEEWAIASSKTSFPIVTNLKVDGIAYPSFENFLRLE